MNQVDFGKIATRSFDIIKHSRFLWLLGFLAGLGFVGMPRLWTLPRANSSSLFSGSNWSNITISPSLLVALLVIGLFFVIAVMYISALANASLIKSVDAIENGSSQRLGSAFRSGVPFAWRILGLSVLAVIVILAVISICVVPIAFLIGFGGKAGISLMLIILTIIMTLVLGIGGIIFFFYMAILLQLAIRSIVLEDCHIIDSVKMAHRVIKAQLMQIIIAYGISVAVRFVAGLILFLVGLTLLAVGVLLFFLTKVAFNGNIAAAITAIIVIFGAVIIIFPLVGAVGAYISTFWTLTYRALTYLEGKKPM